MDGLAFGLVIGLIGRAYARAYLELDIAIVDPSMLAITPIPLILAAFFACYPPPRRGRRSQRGVTLRIAPA